MKEVERSRGALLAVLVPVYVLTGAVCFSMPDWETYGASGNAVATDSNDRIVVAGRSVFTSRFETATVWRFTDDGSPDVAFGGRGFVVLGTGQALSTLETIEVIRDGRIQVAGTGFIGEGNAAVTRYVVYRMRQDGGPDASFGANGRRVIDDVTQSEFDLGRNMAFDDRGQLVGVWGYASDGTPELDPTGKGPTVPQPADPSGAAGSSFRGCVIVDRAGRILVAGSSPNGRMAVWRFRPDGTPDILFGQAGCASYAASRTGTGLSEANAIALQADGRIVVAGSCEGAGGKPDVAVWRLHENGALDMSFNGVGCVVKDARDGTALRDAAYGVAVDSRGRILVAGQSVLGSLGDGTYMILWRFHGDGTIDTSFGRRGLVVSPAPQMRRQ
jgi:uncharacterized delta-60 repeat protein